MFHLSVGAETPVSFFVLRTGVQAGKTVKLLAYKAAKKTVKMCSVFYRQYS